MCVFDSYQMMCVFARMSPVSAQSLMNPLGLIDEDQMTDFNLVFHCNVDGMILYVNIDSLEYFGNP